MKTKKILESFGSYWKWVTRVTEIVSFVFPFKWTDWEARYKKWLADKGIEEKEYMQAAQELWTFIHNNIENYINWKEVDTSSPLYNECKKEIDSAIEWLSIISPEEIYPEVFVKEKNLICNWTIDLLYKKDWKWRLGDWKNFWKAKQRWGLTHSPLVPTAKKKKVGIQMNIYAYILRQAGIIVEAIELLSLTDEGLKIVELEIMTDKEIETIFLAFQRRGEWLTINNMTDNIKAPLEIRIQTAPVAYSAIEVKLNLWKLDGITPEDALNELIRVHQKLHNSYLPKEA